MTEQLIPFLRDVIGRVIPFASLISYVHLKELPDGRLYAKASASDGSIHLTATSKSQISIDEGRACLGNLLYLNQLLNSDMMKNNQHSVVINTRERNNKTIISSLQFHPNKRMMMNYVTTDPFRASIQKPLQIDISDWPVIFFIDEQAFSEISSFKRVHAAAPSTGKEDVLLINFSNHDISIDFGEGGTSHTSALQLDVEPESETTKIISIHLLADQFIRALMLFKDTDGLIETYMSAKAIMLKCETPIADHELVLAGRKLRDD